MANGLDHPGSQSIAAAAAQPAPPPDSYADMQSAIIKVNFGLSWRQIATLVVGMPALIGSVGVSGWLVMPAKQSDVTKLEQQVTAIKTQVQQVQDVGVKLTDAVSELARNVQVLVDRPRVPAPMPKRKPQ